MQTTIQETQTGTSAAAIPVPPATVTDGEIIARIKAGDVNAYGSIMRRYNQRIYRVARSFVTDDAAAMDIVQEAHIKAYTRLDKFRGESSFLTWLAAITRNEALMYLRKYRREVAMNDDDMAFVRQNELETVPACLLPDSCLENKQLQTLINKNIDILPENFRTVFVLRAVEQFSVRETSAILGIKEETVKTRYFRAKQLLQGQIQSYMDNAGIKIYEFGGYHCDIVVNHVLSLINRR